MVGERAHDVQVRVAVGDHHSFRPRRRSTRIVDGQKIGFGDLYFVLIVEMRSKSRFEFDPAVPRPSSATKCSTPDNRSRMLSEGSDVAA